MRTSTGRRAVAPRHRTDVAANADFIAIALFQLGGAGAFIDVEDVFHLAYEIAPKRFGWRTRTLPNYKTLYKALVDLEHAHPTLLLKTADGLRRQLSAEGVEWTRAKIESAHEITGPDASRSSIRRPTQHLLNAIAATVPAQRFAAGGEPDITRYELADLLIAAPDSPIEVWRERLETYKAAAEAAGRDDIRSFLAFIEARNPGLFGGRDNG